MNATTNNTKFLIIFGIVAALSLTFGIVNFEAVSPEIAVEFNIPRDDAKLLGKTFLESRRLDLTDMKSSINFVTDGDARIYVEKEFGPKKLVEMAEQEKPLWSWRVRYYKPLQKLEYVAWVGVDGRILGFNRLLEENATAPKIDSLAARALAVAFASGPMGVDLSQWNEVEYRFTDRPNRRDHVIVWELNDYQVGTAPWRMRVEIQGAEVSGFRQFLRVPEDWWRTWEKQRAQNDFFQVIATGLMIGTLLLALYFLYRHIRAGVIKWKLAIALGSGLAVSWFIMGLNSIPLESAYSATTSSHNAFLSNQILMAILAGIGVGINILIFLGAGEPLYRADYPNKLSLRGLFTLRGMKSKEFFEATIAGYLFCAFDIGFITFYYMLGSKIGFWSPAEIKYDESVSTFLPWIYPLAISLYAALTEEFWFRLFGISLFKRLTKSSILAVLLPAVIWAFLHSSYPQEPGFARGIELTIVGVLAGLIMIRFGIWASLVYHYVYDAVLIGLFLFRSNDLYFWTSGLIVCGFLLIPLAVALAFYLKNRRFESVDDLLNSADSVQAVETESIPKSIDTVPLPETDAPHGRPHPKSLRPVYITIGLSIVLLLIPESKNVGDSFSLNVTASKALQLSSEQLARDFNVDPSEFLTSVELWNRTSDGLSGLMESQAGSNDALSYLKRYASPDLTDTLLFSGQGTDHFKWIVRFMKPLDPTEYRAVVSAGREDLRIQKIIADSLSGPSLPQDSATAIADSLFGLAEIDHDAFHLVETAPTKRPNRIDWRFVYETESPVVGEAKFRRAIVLAGDSRYISGRYLKIPESWIRSEDEKPVLGVILNGLTILLILFLVGWSAWKTGTVMKGSELDWKPSRQIFVVFAIATLIGMLLNLHSYWADYETSKPVWSYHTIKIVFDLVAIVSISALGALLFTLATHMTSSPGLTARRILDLPSKNNLTFAEALTAISVVGIMFIIDRFTSLASIFFGHPQHFWILSLPESIETAYPIVHSIKEAFVSGPLGLMALFVLFAFLRIGTLNFLKRFGILMLSILVISSLQLSNTGNWTGIEILWIFIKASIAVTGVYLLISKVVGDRLLSLLYGGILASLIKGSVGLIDTSNSKMEFQGYLLLSFTAISAIYLLYVGFTNRRKIF